MQNCSGMILKNLRWCSENCIFFQSNFSEEQTLSRNLWFFNFFFGILKRTSVEVKKNMVSNCLGDQLWGKTLTRNNSNFFLDIERKLFVLIATCFYWESEKLIQLMQRITFGGHIFKKRCNLQFLGVCAGNCQTPVECFPAELSKLPFLIPEEQCGFMIFLKKLSAHCFFWVLSGKLGIITKQFSVGLWKLHFFVFRGTFSIKKFFFIKFRKLDSCSGYELKFFGV